MHVHLEFTEVYDNTCVSLTSEIDFSPTIFLVTLTLCGLVGSTARLASVVSNTPSCRKAGERLGSQLKFYVKVLATTFVEVSVSHFTTREGAVERAQVIRSRCELLEVGGRGKVAVTSLHDLH